MSATTGGRIALTVALAGALVALPGCAVRYDRYGTTRIGIGLWGFGDPPGVNWDLDWPRRELPELPPPPPPDVPASSAPGTAALADRSGAAIAGKTPAINDNRGCAYACDPAADAPPKGPPLDARGARASRG
jgi:hypothetical protein